MDQQLPVTPTTPPREPSSIAQLAMGLSIGVIISLAVIGGYYYKTKLESLTIPNSSVQQTIKTTPTVTPLSATPLVTPPTISSSEDLTLQENALDTADLSSISSVLDQNEKDVIQFSQ